MDVGKGFRKYGVQATITPKVLLNEDYIAIANESDIENTKSAFSNEACKISPILEDFDSYSMNRCDYCANFYLDELKIPCTTAQLMKLIKMSDNPANFVEWTKYDPTSHRKKPGKYSFYLVSNSVVANSYDKYEQLINEPDHPCPNKEDAKNLIRFEIQCMYPKLYAMWKNHMRLTTESEPSTPKFSNAQKMYDFYGDPINYRRITLPIDAFLSDAISSEVIDKYFRRIVRSGDYYTLAKAKHIVESLDCHPKKKEKVIDALKKTNAYRGIYNVKSNLKGKELLDYKLQLNALDELGINPVTIPRNWGIEHIPNLLNAYYDKCSEVQNEKNQQELLSRFIKLNKKRMEHKKNHAFSYLC